MLDGSNASSNYPFFGKPSITEKLAHGYVSPIPGTFLEISVAFSKTKAARERGVSTLSTALHIWPTKSRGIIWTF
jgi:hypothetical protein